MGKWKRFTIKHGFIMKTSQVFSLLALSLVGLLLISSAYGAEDNAENEAGGDPNVDDKKLTYAKGSLCQYCDYCKFCKFCDVCKACDAICQPGGILDTVTAAIVNALPSHDPEEINKDIDGVKEWIDKSKDEL